MEFDARGWEILDPTPVALPIGAKRPESLQEQMARMIRSEFLLRRQAEGFESVEEADDFEVEDDDGDGEWSSPWELPEDQAAEALGVVKAEEKGEVAGSAGTGKPVSEASGTAPPSAGGLGSGKPGEVAAA